MDNTLSSKLGKPDALHQHFESMKRDIMVHTGDLITSEPYDKGTLEQSTPVYSHVSGPPPVRNK